MSEAGVLDRPLFGLWPQLASSLPMVALADLPTPVTELSGLSEALGYTGAELYEKRDDRTSSLYGGNKVRTLEVLLGRAVAQGCTHVYATGAYGSNHAAATTVHASRVGLSAGALVYPQPPSRAALQNLKMLIARTPPGQLVDLAHWSSLPYGMMRHKLGCRRRGERAMTMPPGGAIPDGALGYVSAGLELALQVRAELLPEPRLIVVPAGSNCTAAGLLIGLCTAHRQGIGFRHPPNLRAIRVTPWPVTSPWRILDLARRTLARLAAAGVAKSELPTMAELRMSLMVDTRYLGRGYGVATAAGWEALRLWERHAGHALETTYSAKAAAAALNTLGIADQGPILYWSTKSSAPMATVPASDLEAAPPRMAAWLEQARATCGE